MGNHESSHSKKHAQRTEVGKQTVSTTSSKQPPKFSTIQNSYESIEQLQEALQSAGLESSDLILGIDYTISNKDAGKHTFNGLSLHALGLAYMNPYQHVISVLSRTLERFSDTKMIPAFGFGDKSTTSKSVFPFQPDGSPCFGVATILQRYSEITPNVELSGPTSFAPIINEAIRIVQAKKSYHILVIIADGEITPDTQWNSCMSETTQAIVRASSFPLSIIVVGVGDGPWDTMEEYDDKLPSRKFDNFQFVNFVKEIGTGDALGEASFALACLQEIPEQYNFIKSHGMI